MADPNISREKILDLEFQYARETAAQSMSDRTAVVNLYLILVGGTGSIALSLAQSKESSHIGLVFLFALLGVTGFFTFMKLVRLRQAWEDSARAMNRIKDYYLKQFPELADAFYWKTTSIPPPGKLWTITFNLALLVALIDSIAIGVAIYFTGWRVPLGEYLVAGFAGLMYFAWQIWFYFFQLPISTKEAK